MKTVPLHGEKAAGRVALVDDEDYDLVMQYRWNVQEKTTSRWRSGPYARAWIPGGHGKEYVFMHTLIAGYPKPDHIDGDGLNNQRANLRPATASQNNMNKRKAESSRRFTSRYLGVRRVPRSSRWAAGITKDRIIYHLGSFASEIDAALAYDAAARELFGEYARPNFPQIQGTAPDVSKWRTYVRGGTEKKCASCGESFPAHRGRGGARRYCSDVCKSVAQGQRKEAA